MLDFLFKRKRREALLETPLSAEQRETVHRKVPYVTMLREDDQRELEGHIQVFLAEKTFEGCAGLELTDEMKLTIAAQACILLLHRQTDYYPSVESILVYPSTYLVKNARRVLGAVAVEGDEARVGESWARGVVVLSWDAVTSGAEDPRDGHNVVFHEFAHQLDAEGGAENFGSGSAYLAFARALGAEYDDLVRRVLEHRSTDIDAYGATSPAEFFAVVTEAFFERGERLEEKHPELYAVLREFYRQDPAARK